MAKRDYYDILEVEKNSSKDDIKKSYRKLSMKHHPDKGGEKESFHEIQEAYDTLTDDRKRKEYDQFGFAGQQDQFSYSSTSDPWSQFNGVGNFKDLFGQFYSNVKMRQKNQSQHRVSTPISVGVRISFMEAIKGTKIKFEFKRKIKCSGCKGTGKDEDSEVTICPVCGGAGAVRRSSGFFSISQSCSSCSGTGQIIKKPCKICGGRKYQIEKKKIEVTVPPGTENDHVFRISNEGNQDLDAPGSLVIKVKIDLHEYFNRVGNHIQIHIPITITQSMLGATISVPTVHGENVEVRIPKMTKDFTTFIVKNQGIEKIGSMSVIVHIKFPKKLTDKEIEILEKLEDELQSSYGPKPVPLKEL